MIKQSFSYQTMNQLLESLQQLQLKLDQLPDRAEDYHERWQEVEEQLQVVDELIHTLAQVDPLKEVDYPATDWQAWRQLVSKTQTQHQKTLQMLMAKKEAFYQEVQSVGRSVKANRAYNEMKRIRF